MHLNTDISDQHTTSFGNTEKSCFWYLQNIDNQHQYLHQTLSYSTGKEKDSLRLNPQSEGLCGARLTSPLDLFTRFYYFGARYYDCDLSGLFLSVDPMADKYPSMSPYSYCAWNPVKLVDPDGKKIRGVKYNYKTQQFSYSKGAIRRGTKRYIEARITTENGRKGIMDLVNSKRKFTIKVTDNPLFIDNGNKTYSQLHGKTIEDDYSLNTIIIVSTASKIQNSTVGYVVSNSKDKGEKNIDYNLISTDLNSGMEAVLKETGLRDFEAIHPYKSEEQLIHGIGAHEEEHALRPLDDERQEEVNAQKAEMRERIEYIKEVANE